MAIPSPHALAAPFPYLAGLSRFAERAQAKGRVSELHIAQQLAEHWKRAPDSGYIVHPSWQESYAIAADLAAAAEAPTIIILPNRYVAEEMRARLIAAGVADHDIGSYHAQLSNGNGDADEHAHTASNTRKKDIPKKKVLLCPFTAFASLNDKGLVSAQKEDPHFRPLVIFQGIHRGKAPEVSRRLKPYIDNATVIGFTTHEQMADGKTIGETVFKNTPGQTAISTTRVQDAVNHFEMAPHKNIVITSNVVSQVGRVKGRDYTDEEREQLVDQYANRTAAVRWHKDYTDPDTGDSFADKKAIAFCNSINDANVLAAEFNREFGSGYARAVHSDHEDKEVKAALKEFKEGGFHVLCTPEMVLHGHSFPDVDVHYCLRLTRSPLVAMQMGAGVAQLGPAPEETPTKYVLSFINKQIGDLITYGQVAQGGVHFGHKQREYSNGNGGAHKHAGHIPDLGDLKLDSIPQVQQVIDFNTVRALKDKVARNLRRVHHTKRQEIPEEVIELCAEYAGTIKALEQDTRTAAEELSALSGHAKKLVNHPDAQMLLKAYQSASIPDKTGGWCTAQELARITKENPAELSRFLDKALKEKAAKPNAPLILIDHIALEPRLICEQRGTPKIGKVTGINAAVLKKNGAREVNRYLPYHDAGFQQLMAAYSACADYEVRQENIARLIKQKMPNVMDKNFGHVTYEVTNNPYKHIHCDVAALNEGMEECKNKMAEAWQERCGNFMVRNMMVEKFRQLIGAYPGLEEHLHKMDPSVLIAGSDKNIRNPDYVFLDSIINDPKLLLLAWDKIPKEDQEKLGPVIHSTLQNFSTSMRTHNLPGQEPDLFTGRLDGLDIAGSILSYAFTKNIHLVLVRQEVLPVFHLMLRIQLSEEPDLKRYIPDPGQKSWAASVIDKRHGDASIESPGERAP